MALKNNYVIRGSIIIAKKNLNEEVEIYLGQDNIYTDDYPPIDCDDVF